MWCDMILSILKGYLSSLCRHERCMLQQESRFWGRWNRMTWFFCTKLEKSTLHSVKERRPRFTITSQALRAFQCVYIFIYLAINWMCVQIGFGGSVLAVFNAYEDTYSGMSEICVWMSAHENFSHSCHQQIIQNIWFASPTGTRGDLVILSKKDVRRSWEERWSEIAGERRALINRRSRWLFGSQSSLSWNTFLSLRLFSLFSSSLNLPLTLKCTALYIQTHTILYRLGF